MSLGTLRSAATAIGRLVSEPPRGEMRLPALRRTQLILFFGLVIAFVAFRWAERREPWNSDDMSMFELSVDAAAGRHWVFGAAFGGANSADGLPAQVGHIVFRIGLLPLSVPAIHLFGASATAYYVVPLIFALIGFSALYWVMLTRFGSLVACVFALIHLAWPFELEHGSLFLTDLPAAAVALVSICLLDAATNGTPRSRFMYALLAGGAAFETYLLRNNGLALLGPAYLVFLWSRSTRAQTLVAVAVACLGVFGQQAFMVYRGFSWGYDWSTIRADFAEYAPFLSVYSWGRFLVRQFAYQVSTFGHGFTGYVAALLVAGSLVMHVLLLRFERQALLRAIAAFGLFAWLVFSYSIYELVPGGVRATVPVNFRFVQPFTYSSLVAWAWAWTWLRQKVAAAGSTTRSQPALRRGLTLAALPALLLVFSIMALGIRAPETYRAGATRSLVQSLQRFLTEGGEPLLVAGTGPSLRVPQVFCCGGPSRPVQWQELSPQALRELVERKSTALVLRDVQRELTRAKYFTDDARAAYREELARIDEHLWSNYGLAHVDGTYVLFTPPAAGIDPSRLAVSPITLDVANSPPSGALLITGATCRVAPNQGEPSRTLTPPQGAGKNSSCEYMWLEDGRVISSSSAAARAESSDQGFVLRLHADYEVPLSLSVDIVQYGAHGVQRQKQEVPAGTSYQPVRLLPETTAIFLVYQLKTRGAPPGHATRIRPAQWRPHRFTAVQAPTAMAP